MQRSSDGHQPKAQDRDERSKDPGSDDKDIDQVLADSFPASDAPPWTLGVTDSSSGITQKPKTQRD
jgi:hypothetical protein